MMQGKWVTNGWEPKPMAKQELANPTSENDLEIVKTTKRIQQMTQV